MLSDSGFLNSYFYLLHITAHRIFPKHNFTERGKKKRFIVSELIFMVNNTGQLLGPMAAGLF